ncbi:hypothetical protein A3D11_04285 [Candidatus Peribacteria bacterium RIFCSPHIGHO2_02_FULL_49_16]|nr:MAG: hypothetical protein A2880_00375 [Candidatus Peribacteria bacterium RIFCSPHIGHO2_01_FULL_49_38]OGJ59212.1 MAG: hypothetical protein A3D11_04285 [Candidatus Peribacteria bacterium RIFCSPHIGHO2_02_FULL_49_16]
MSTRLTLFIIGLLLLTACSSKEAVSVETGEGMTEVINVAMPSGGGKINDPKHGEEISIAIGAVVGVNDTVANGVATMHFFEDGVTFVGIQANMYTPPKGSFFEAWAALKDDKSTWITLGHLTNPQGDVRHILNAQKEKNLREYKRIIITKELDDGNPEPQDVVAEAKLEEKKR